MVEYSKLRGAKGPAAAQKTGFTVECFPLFEQQKAELFREQRGAAELLKTEPVWQPNDPRWNVKPPWGWLGPIHLKYANRCVYCGELMKVGERAVYSKKISSVAHVECQAGVDP